MEPCKLHSVSLCFRATLNEMIQKDRRCVLDSIKKWVVLFGVVFEDVHVKSFHTVQCIE